MPSNENLRNSHSCNSIQESEYVLVPDILPDYQTGYTAANFETAIHYSGHGKYQFLLLGVCGTIYATCAISTTTLSFVLPSAKCDFVLNSVDKGKLSAMPLIGMVFGCCVWGSLADSHGRKVAIMMSLLLDFIAAVISSFAQSFVLFLICRFFNGFGIIGATSLVFSYLGEFLSEKNRDRMLGRLEVFWNVGVIILPGVAWGLLNRTLLKIFEDKGNFSPWRIFVLVCSLPSLISFLMIYFLPETPKFLLSQGKYKQAKQVFQQIYAFNTGNHIATYPVLTLDGEESCEISSKSHRKRPIRVRIQETIETVCCLMKTLCSQPHIKYLSITSFTDFGLMASYYTLIMWFPEIFDRFSDYEKENPENPEAGICVVSENRPNLDPIFLILPCDSAIDNRVFLDTIIIGLSCIPTSISLSFFMQKMGKKFVLLSGLVISGIATISLNWVKNSTQTLVLSCVFEAFTSILEAVIFCVVVDLFPTNLRAIALAITATSGRLGAIFGNIIFGVLIDYNCIVPIYLFGFMLIASGLLCMAIPRKENYIALH